MYYSQLFREQVQQTLNPRRALFSDATNVGKESRHPHHGGSKHRRGLVVHEPVLTPKRESFESSRPKTPEIRFGKASKPLDRVSSHPPKLTKEDPQE